MTSDLHEQIAYGSAGHRSAQSLANAASFCLSAAAAFAIAISASFYSTLSSIHLAAILVALLFVQVQLQPRIFFCREFSFYTLFIAYMFIQLTWTENAFLALNTLVPAVNFVVILVLFSSLIAFHNLRSVLVGFLVGIMAGAAVFSLVEGFPLRYPAWFSYNSMALLYFSGLYISLLLGSTQRTKALYLVIGLVFLMLVVATTSIKTNLGIVLGAASAYILFFRYFTRILARHVVLLTVLVAILAYSIASSDALVEKLHRGMDRIALGVEILQARESIPGYGGFESRARWFMEGISGWSQNPVFGHGVEAFRSRFGMTSHSTAIDILYNSGLIGFGLFYAAFMSLAWRLRTERTTSDVSVRAVIIGTLICFFFITLSGTMHYNTFLAAFFGISTGLLHRHRLYSPATQSTYSGTKE